MLNLHVLKGGGISFVFLFLTRNNIGEVTSLLGDDLVYCGWGLEVNFDPVRLFGLGVGFRVQDSI